MLMFLYGAHVAQILAGQKTETRRKMETTVYDYALAPSLPLLIALYRVVPLYTVYRDSKVLYRIGQEHAVVPGRGKRSVGRVRITGLRLEAVGEIDEPSAQAEGGYTPAEYEALWRKIHTYKGTYYGGHVRIAIRFELVADEPAR